VIDLSQLDLVRPESDGRLKIGVGIVNQQIFDALAPLQAGLPHGRCPNTGVGGFVLGGGFGFTSRTMGMLSDTLRETEIITASGDILTCSESQNADLFWACRGGAGGSFGINTSYTLQTVPLPKTVSVYKITWPYSDASEALPALQQMMVDAPNELGCRIGLGKSGMKGRMTEGMDTIGEYVGPSSELRELLDPVIKTGRPTDVTIKDVGLLDATAFLAADIPAGRFAARSSYAVDPFPDAAVDRLIRHIDAWPGSTNRDGAGIAIFCLGGEVNEVPADATAYPHRTARFLINVETTWRRTDPEGLVRENRDWLNALWEAMQPDVLPSSYQNWPDRDLENWESAYFGSNLQRLTEIKKRYDSDNVFRYQQSVPLST
jgi:hypothetical protein